MSFRSLGVLSLALFGAHVTCFQQSLGTSEPSRIYGVG